MLTAIDCDNIINFLKILEEKIKEYCEAINRAIVEFENNTVVQKFFQSGDYGKGMAEALVFLKNEISDLYELLSSPGELIPYTKGVVDESKTELNKKFQRYVFY